jgi:hypothetical protein
VPLAVPQPNARAAAACEQLIAALPGELDGLTARGTDPESSLTAAYGRPAVTVRCGVPRPEALGLTSRLLVVDEVDWFPEELTNGVRFTTTGRVAYLQVDVPDDHAPGSDLLVDLAAPVLDHLPISEAASPAG